MHNDINTCILDKNIAQETTPLDLTASTTIVNAPQDTIPSEIVQHNASPDTEYLETTQDNAT